MAEPKDPFHDGRRARGAKSRQAMVAAATTLFSTQGYSATGMSMIANRAGVNTGSIYHAFGSKEGLLEAVMHSVADTMFRSIENLDSDPDASPSSKIESVARLLIDEPVFLRLFLLLALEQDHNESVRAIVESVRSRARAAVVASIEPALGGLPGEVRAAVDSAIGRITLILLDGIFVSHQLDSESADLSQTLVLVTTMVELTLAHFATVRTLPSIDRRTRKRSTAR